MAERDNLHQAETHTTQKKGWSIYPFIVGGFIAIIAAGAGGMFGLKKGIDISNQLQSDTYDIGNMVRHKLDACPDRPIVVYRVPTKNPQDLPVYAGCINTNSETDSPIKKINSQPEPKSL